MEQTEHWIRHGQGKVIALIHGIGAKDPRDYWHRFLSVLKNDEKFQEFGVFVWKYPTHVSPAFLRNTLSAIKRKTLRETAPKLKQLGSTWSTTYRTQFQGYQDVLLVCHSMGGLVIKSWIIDALSRGHSAELATLRHIAFYATPHNGAPPAAIANWNDQLKDMQLDSSFIKDVGSRWNEHVVAWKGTLPGPEDERFNIYIPHLVIAGNMDIVVPPGNATITSKHLELVNGDHSTVIQPDNSTDTRYKVWSNDLEITLKSNTKKTNVFSPPAPSLPQEEPELPFAIEQEQASEFVPCLTNRSNTAKIDSGTEKKEHAESNIARTKNFTVGTTLYTCTSHTESVVSVAWSPDGKNIASGSFDKTVQIWEANTGDILSIYKSHTDQISSIAWSPDGKHIASASIDGIVQIWEVANGNKNTMLKNFQTPILSIKYSPDGMFLAAGCYDNAIRVVNISKESVRTYKKHTGPVLDVSWFTSNSKFIVSSSEDETIRIWNAITGRVNDSEEYQFEDIRAVRSVACSPFTTYSDTRIACALESSRENKSYKVIVREVNEMLKEPIEEYNETCNAHAGIIYAVAWSPDGRYIASASADKTVQVWNIEDGELFYTYRGHSRGVRAVAWSPDGRYIVSASDDKTVQVWQAV